MSPIKTLEQESHDLELHVDLCAQRYKELSERMDRVEARIDKLTEDFEQRMERIESVLLTINEKITTNERETLNRYLGWAGVIITGLIGAAAWAFNKIL